MTVQLLPGEARDGVIRDDPQQNARAKRVGLCWKNGTV